MPSSTVINQQEMGYKEEGWLFIRLEVGGDAVESSRIRLVVGFCSRRDEQRLAL